MGDSIHPALINLSLTNERCGKGVGRKQSSLALRVNIKNGKEGCDGTRVKARKAEFPLKQEREEER